MLFVLIGKFHLRSNWAPSCETSHDVDRMPEGDFLLVFLSYFFFNSVNLWRVIPHSAIRMTNNNKYNFGSKAFAISHIEHCSQFDTRNFLPKLIRAYSTLITYRVIFITCNFLLLHIWRSRARNVTGGAIRKQADFQSDNFFEILIFKLRLKKYI